MSLSARSHFVLTSDVSCQSLMLVKNFNIISIQGFCLNKLLGSLKTMRQQLVVSQLIYLCSLWFSLSLSLCVNLIWIFVWHYSILAENLALWCTLPLKSKHYDSQILLLKLHRCVQMKNPISVSLLNELVFLKKLIELVEPNLRVPII